MADPLLETRSKAEASTGVARHFRIAAPANWFTLGLDPTTYRENLRVLIEQRLGTGAEHEVARRDLFELLERFTADAIEQGAIQAFMLSDKIGDRPLAASLVCTVAATPETPVLDDVAAGMRSAAKRGAYSEVKVVELPCGLAVRTRSRRKAHVPVDPAPALEVEVVQYFLAVPGRDALLLLSFSTPDLAVSDAFVELFDAMAASLNWES